MSGTRRIAIFAPLVLLVAVVGSCTFQESQLSKAFTETKIGDTKEEVLNRFGNSFSNINDPRLIEAYGIADCQPECTERLLWEAPFPVPKGLEAWGVDFDSRNRVAKKYQIFFP